MFDEGRSDLHRSPDDAREANSEDYSVSSGTRESVIAMVSDFWAQLEPSLPLIGSPRVLKGHLDRPDRSKTLVLRLQVSQGDPRTIIAKRTTQSTAESEAWVYRNLLPMLGLNGPNFYGVFPEPDSESAWLFLEDGGDSPVSEDDDAACGSLSTWLARLHVLSSSLDHPSHLPMKGARQATIKLDKILVRGEELLGSVHSQDAVRGTIVKLLDDLTVLGDRFSRIATQLDSFPRSIVHGDFASKNLRFVPGQQDRILVFDWEMIGWGTPAEDLGTSSCVQLRAYADVCRRMDHPLGSADIKQLRVIGRFLRLVSAVDWSLPRSADRLDSRARRLLEAYRVRVSASRASPGWVL